MEGVAENFGRGLGGPRRDGKKLFGRKPKGEDGAGRLEEPAVVDGMEMLDWLGIFGRIGEEGRPIWEGAGEADRNVLEGEPGLAIREILGIAGLAGLAGRSVANREGESGRVPAAKRDICADCTGVCGSGLPGLLGPATRRRRSSSCVLSFGDNGPTSDQTFSPINE